MAVNTEAFVRITSELGKKNVSVVAVSKTKSEEEILELYNLGQRDFGENYVQEMVAKAQALPKDIRWHFIGHLQTNKVKQIAPFVHLVQSADSLKLLKEINKQSKKQNRKIDCLLQVHIAVEESKFGLDATELQHVMENLKDLQNVGVAGLMGIASFTDDQLKIRQEFQFLDSLFKKYKPLFTSEEKKPVLSMGMSADYKIAIEEGGNMVRIGSLFFGKRS
jgi:pyridoxal phosphate enzyme (YggS family)